MVNDVGQALMSQTEQAGLGKVDGVMSVDPEVWARCSSSRGR